MATLSGAVNATEGLWTISADLDDAIDYLQVEDEIVRVVGNFPSSTYAPTGAVTPPKIRVEREAGGTTAASHADGTTLTPVIPPSAGGGAAEAGTVVEVATDEPPVEQRGFYYGETEPVGAAEGSYWVDLTGGPPFQTKVLSQAVWVIAPMILKDAGGTVLASVAIDAAGVITANTIGATSDSNLTLTPDGEAGLWAGLAGLVLDPAAGGSVLLADFLLVTPTGLNMGGALIDGSGNPIFPALPTADPVVAGALWNDTGTVKVSTG